MSNNVEVTYLKDYRAPNYTIDSVHLYFNLLENCAEVMATTHYTQKAGCPAELELYGKDFELLSLHVNGENPVNQIKTKRGIQLGSLPPKFELKVKTRLKPDENKSFMGLYKSETLYCTQMESNGFRTVSYFLDRPDALSKYTTVIEADKTKFPDLLANGNLVATQDLGNGRHTATWVDPFAKPAYLFALVAGDLDHISDTFTTMSGRKVDLRIYTEKGQVDRCHFAMEALKRSMKWDEERFGREYDLDLFMIVAVRDFNFGAMENKGLNIFNSAVLLANPQITTDAKYDTIEAIIGHEYFHNWSGNRVTCRDWFQLCLKEGFTVFRDQEFSADIGSRGLKRVQDVIALRAHQFSEDSGPLAHPVRPESFVTIDNFYTSTVYEKGGELIRMQQQLLGWETFRKGCDLYFERFDGQAVTMEDFISCMSEVSGKDLSQFSLWYSQAGTPELTLSRTKNGKGELEVTIDQKTPPTPGQDVKKPLHMPFKIGFLDHNGNSLGEKLLELTKASETFTFDGVPADVVISPLREFTAPVTLKWTASDAELETLIKFDSDPFNAWESWQKFFTNDFESLIKNQNVEASSAKLVKVLVEALENHKKDAAFAAEFLSIPSLIKLQKNFGKEFSFDGIVLTRRELLKQMSALENASFTKLQAEAAKLEKSDLPNERSHRALKNASMGFAAYAQNSEYLDFVLSSMKSAKNMTDEISALYILNRDISDQRAEGNLFFYEKWKSEPLVVDMWLAAKTSCTDVRFLDEVEALAESEFGQSTNPNRNRSIYAHFAVNNPTLFHHQSGRGYGLVGKRVLAMDKFNPQLAARTAGFFADVSIMDKHRKSLALNELRAMLGADISENLREIVTKLEESIRE
jgi:aminopeptidase N